MIGKSQHEKLGPYQSSILFLRGEGEKTCYDVRKD